MTNLTTERVIGLSTDNQGRLNMYNNATVSEVEVPTEPIDFKEFMDQEQQLDFQLDFQEIQTHFEIIHETTHYINPKEIGGN